MGLQGEQFMEHNLWRAIRDNQREIRSLQTARRLEKSSISVDGMTIKETGSIRSDNFDGTTTDVLGDPGTEGWALGSSGLVANNGVFRGEVRSANFVKGESGYRLLPTGDAELNDAILRGDIASSDFDGDLDADDPGTTGWAMDDSGKAAFNTLLLGDRIIGPTALGITWDGAGDSATNFALTTGGANVVSDSIVVPEFATEALVILTVTASVVNTSGADDTAQLRGLIDGTGGAVNFSLIPAGDWDNVTATAQRVVTSPGATIDVVARMSTVGGGWSADTSNIASVDAVALFRA